MAKDAGQMRRPIAVERDERPLLAPELVGREQQLASLDAALAGAVAGNGRIVLISGSAGIGKTALLRVFLARARSIGAQALIGECSEAEAARPFGPLVDVLRSALETSPAVVERWLQKDASELARFLPERTGGWIELPSSAADRFRSHESFAALFADLARSRPLVLAVEDVHFADPATLESLPYLGRKLRGDRVLIVITYRSDELHRLHPLRPTLAELGRTTQTTSLELPPLGAANAGRLVQAALGQASPLTSDFRRALDEVCEGNPFFIEEVLKTLAQRGDLVYSDGAWAPVKEVRDLAIPDSVRSAVDHRVNALQPDAQRALRVAAVIGRRFDFDLLGRVSEIAERALLDALAEARDAQLIVEERDEGGDHFAFRHALTREAVLATLLQREQRSLHLAVAGELERRAGSDPARVADALAYHFDEAGDVVRALRYHELAAREASRVFAFASAVRHLERACALAPQDDRMVAALYLRLADAAEFAREVRRQLRAAETARTLFATLGDATGLTSALGSIARSHMALANLSAAGRFAADAVRAGEPLGAGPELAEAYRTACLFAWFTGDYPALSDNGEKAIRVARDSGATFQLVTTMAIVGRAMTHQGRADEGLAVIREALAIALERGSFPAAETAYNELGYTLRDVGAPRVERRAVYEEHLRYCRPHGYRAESTLWRETDVAFSDGDWEGVRRLAAETQGTAWAQNPAAAGPALLAAFVGVAREGPKRFVDLALEARRLQIADGKQFALAYAAGSAAVEWIAGAQRATLEQAALFADRVASTEPAIRRAAWGAQSSIGPVAIVALLAAESLGDDAAVERWTELMCRDEKSREPHALTASRLFAQARRAVRHGELASALNLLTEAEQALFEGDLPFGLTVTRLERANLLLRRDAPGDRAGAAEELAAALPYWQRAQATWYLAVLRRWAAKRKLPFPALPPDQSARAAAASRATSVLSRREHEVAELVALGMTNAQIADKLTITVRTAEAHVEHIRNKLGFHSRVQIGAWTAGTLVRPVGPASPDSKRLR